LLQPVTPSGKIHPVWAAITAASLAIAIIWTAAGPLRPGWNDIANNGNGSGGVVQAAGSSTATATPTANATSAAPFSQPFTASLQGSMSHQTDANTGQPILRLDLTLGGAQQGILQIDLWEQGDNNGGISGGNGQITATKVTLGVDAAAPLYQGQVSTLNGGYMVAQLDPTQPGQPSLQLTINVQAQGENVSGTVSAMPLALIPGVDALL
jgi:hypothetical protein